MGCDVNLCIYEGYVLSTVPKSISNLFYSWLLAVTAVLFRTCFFYYLRRAISETCYRFLQEKCCTYMRGYEPVFKVRSQFLVINNLQLSVYGRAAGRCSEGHRDRLTRSCVCEHYIDNW
jgi:hypothetical protein